LRPLGSIQEQTGSLEVSTTKILTDERPLQARRYPRVDGAQVLAAPALRVGEPHPRAEHQCQERDNKCLITDLYNVLESRKGLARRPNFVEDGSSGPRLDEREILEEKEFRLARFVALCRISHTLTTSISVAQ